MATKLHTMTEAELDILARSSDNPNIFFDYWFRKEGADRGWQLDYNFVEDQKWQQPMCMAAQSFIVIIAGICTGKTLGVVMSAAYHATLTRSFKFLNIAAQGWQSGLMHSALIEQAKGTPFEKLIVSSPTRPYHKIVISFKIGERVYESVLQFLSTGEKGDATNIMSWRGDWVNIEEAGLIDNLSEVIGNLVTRLTGVTAEGREFLARMSLISNPWDNLELWMQYDMALADTEDGLVFNIDTAANRNATPRQVKLALKRIPEQEHEKFMTGNRPQGRGDFFEGTDIEACESEELQNHVIRGIQEKKPGFILHKDPILGVWYFQIPKRSGRVYYVIGDPGTGAAPARNAPTIGVFDVTEGVKLAIMVAFWWGNGGGQIAPFYNQLFKFMREYEPLETFVDNTGTQANTAQIINLDYFEELREMGSKGIIGLSFASTKKITYLRCAQTSIENHTIIWPKFLGKNVSAQHKNYSLKKDKEGNSKLPQDCVAMVSMAAFSIRAWRRRLGDEDDGEDDEQEQHKNPRDRRSDNRSRSRTYGRDPRREREKVIVQ